MSHKDRTPRRFSHGDVDPGEPVAMWFLLTAVAGQGEAMVASAQQFCVEVGNARVVDPGPSGNAPDVRYVYIVVDGGGLAGAVQGGPEATAAVVTARALVGRLFMFSPALVADPAGKQSA